MNELRTSTVLLAVEAREDGKPDVLVGYAATFDQPYPVDIVQETIDQRAFDRTLKEQPDVFALIGHDMSRVIARTKNGTMLLSPDQRGLRVEISPVDTQESRDAFALVRSGTLDSMSFGFRINKQQYKNLEGQVHRRIMDLDLFEVSLVAFPANPAATLSLRDRELIAQAKQIALPFLPPPPLAQG